MPNCRTCGTHIGGGEGHSLKDGPKGECTWLCKECNERKQINDEWLRREAASDARRAGKSRKQDDTTRARAIVLEAFRLGSRQGWDRCIESLGDFSGDGVVTDDMIAWLKKEMLEDSV